MVWNLLRFPLSIKGKRGKHLKQLRRLGKSFTRSFCCCLNENHKENQICCSLAGKSVCFMCGWKITKLNSFHFNKISKKIVGIGKGLSSKEGKQQRVCVNLILLYRWLLWMFRWSDGINWVHFVVRTAVVVELDLIVHITLDERHCVVYSHRLRELTVRLQISGLVWCVFEDDIGLCVLVVSQPN